MVDITAKLIWYRLGETFDKMATAAEMLWLDWDDHILDILLFGWIGWAALIVLVVNGVLTFFGPLQPRMNVDRVKEGKSGATVAAGTGNESCQWLNSALNWFYLHYDKFPEFVDAWVKALNEQVVKLGGPVQIKFERVKSGSLPPKFSDVTFEAGPEDKYDGFGKIIKQYIPIDIWSSDNLTEQELKVVHCKVDSKDLSFAIFASQQTHEGVKLTNLTTNILKLKGALRLRCFIENGDMMVNIAFEGRPDVKVKGKPVNPYQNYKRGGSLYRGKKCIDGTEDASEYDPSDLVDIEVVEEVIRNSICLASADFNITRWIAGGGPGHTIISSTIPFKEQPSPKPGLPRPEAVFEPIEAKQQQSAFHSPGLASVPRPSRPPPGEKRLLVKVIKASGLGARQAGSVDPECVVFMDMPPQSQTTSTVRSTINPFWDEQFLFDVNSNTTQLKFEVVDKRKPSGSNFLGEAIVYFDDLKRNPSSRQIIPLQGSGDNVSGSITVEFLFLEANEADALEASILPQSFGLAQTSPRRTIEVNKSVTPGGTIVTTTTTTTQKSQNARHEAAVDASPNYVQKRNAYNYDSSEQTSAGDRTSSNLADRSLSSSSEVILVNGGESVAETAIRELRDPARKSRSTTRTSTLIITGVKREPARLPVNKTMESSPTEDINESVPTVTTHPPSPQQPEKKKGMSFAQQIKKRFSRSKKRSQSADRGTGSLREGSNYLQPPDQRLHPRSKDDIELVRSTTPETPNLKKSRSLGGSLKKLFRRSRKRSRSRGETSRESSFSRSSTRNVSQGPSREGSLSRTPVSPHSQETAIS